MTSKNGISNPNVESSNLSAPSRFPNLESYQSLNAFGQLQSSDNPYLRAQVRQVLENADFEPDPDRRWKMLQRLRDLARSLRRFDGFSVYWPIAFASISCVLLAIFLIRLTPKVQVYEAPHVYVRVVKVFNAFDFELQNVVDGVVEAPSVWHFCRDYEPKLEQGFTLTRLAYVDKGECAWIGPIDHAYRIQRGPDGWPTIPGNCTNSLSAPVACDGEPKF